MPCSGRSLGDDVVEMLLSDNDVKFGLYADDCALCPIVSNNNGQEELHNVPFFFIIMPVE